jgi:uracil-DNA glycosylase
MPVSSIKVVLLGQDPYHGPGQAHGLSFSVPAGVPIPPSLRNIFKELQTEFPEREYKFTHGCLTAWHGRGIFLLNTALTVAPGKPNSHADRWTEWTDKVIEFIVANNSTCIFLLLGAFAQKKAILIDNPARWVFGIHPSPLSAHRGFFGSGIFLKVEEKLGEQIDWQN